MAEMIKRNTVQTQLNEKVSTTEYDVLHPETHADVVITTEEKQFVSAAEKERWDNMESTLSEKGLLFYGDWVNTTTYPVNAVVQYNGKYYIAKQEAFARTPSDSADTNYWRNINIESFTAQNAEKVKTVTIGTNREYNITFVNSDNATADYEDLYTDAGITYNPSTDTLKTGVVEAGTFKGNLEGTADKALQADKADVAEKYVEYNYDASGAATTPSGNTPRISDAVHNLGQRIDNLEGGGTVLSNKLTVTKDGENPVEYDGSAPISIDIKQTYKTEDITDLLDVNKKILEKWLPDTILGQLSYKGTWNPAVAGTVAPRYGDYYIAKGEGRYCPDGTALPTTEEPFQTGDWAVYNGTTWDKIDNTDTVRSVNGQIGDVETYKGEWKPTTVYFSGDIVKVGNVLYLCSADHTSATDFIENNWILFGRTYTGSDAIKVEGSVIKHDVTVESGTTTDTTLGKNETFNVPVLTTDAFGHTVKIDVKRIKLGEDFVDTTRQINLNGTKILDGSGDNKNKILDFGDSEYIKGVYENDKLTFNHKLSDAGALTLNSQKVTEFSGTVEEIYAGQGYTVPTFTTDTAGHVILGSMKTYKLADSLIKHNHFDIVKDENGAQTIQAYSADKATVSWINSNPLKFYLGSNLPASAQLMNFNGELRASKLYQKANAVLDGSMKIYSGININNNAILGSYDATNNRLNMGASGVGAGVYSAVNVNEQGIVTAGGQIVEFGTVIGADPSESLAVGGLFFRKLA